MHSTICLSLELSSRWSLKAQCSRGKALVSFHTDFLHILEEDLLLAAWLSHLYVNVFNDIFRK